MAVEEEEEEQRLPGCRSATQRPCTERRRTAPAWGCTGDMEKTQRLPQGRRQLIPGDGDQRWGPWRRGNPAFSSQVPKYLQGGSRDGGTGMFYLQDRGQEDGNPRQHKDDDARHSLLPGTAREAG